jgi:fibronectin-binding autotransporter adhesin
MKLPHLHYIGLLCPLLASSSLYAANRTWDGGGTGDVWSSNQNWNGNSALATGDTLVFAGTTKLSNTNDLSNFSFPTITFDATAGAFILGGNSFTLTGNIINNSTNLQTVGNNITLSAATHTINAVSGNIALSGIISGTGAALTKSGSGTLILSSSNTYTGATTISSGVLQLGNGGTTGTLSTSSSIANDANLTINRSNTATQGTDFSSAAISGTGSFTQAGSGTTILTAANSYTGTTTLSAGFLQLGNGGTTGSLSASSAITNNANLTINRSNTVTQGTDFSSAAITGTGSFTQAGTGTTVLNTANTYSGSTTVTAGNLSVNGTLANTSNVNVLGGTLGGSGTIGGVTTVGGNGTLAAGSSPGVLTFTNNLTLTQEVGVDGGSLAYFEIGGLTRGTEYDGVDVGGTLIYGGTLEIVSFNGYDLTDVATFTNPVTVFDLFGMPGSPNDPTFSGNFDHVSVGGYALNNVGSGIWTGSNNDESVTYTFDQTTGDLSIVPEPVAAFLGGIGLLTLLRRRRN